MLVSGLRDEYVGTDTKNYKEIYLIIKSFNSSFEDVMNKVGFFEPGFMYLNYAISKLNFSYHQYFIVLAIINWGLFFLFIRQHSDKINLVLFFCIASGFLFFSFNAFRQIIAVLIFANSARYIERKNFLKYAITISIGALFHFTLFLLLPLYFIVSKVNLKSSSWFILTTFGLLLSFSGFIQYDFFEIVMPEVYKKYIGGIINFGNSSFGFGILFQFISIYLIIYHYDSIGKKGDNQVQFKISLLGGVLYALFWDNLFLTRFTYYLYFFQFPVLAMILRHYLNKGNLFISYSIIMSYTLFFIFKIYVSDSGCSPYNFYF